MTRIRRLYVQYWKIRSSPIPTNADPKESQEADGKIQGQKIYIRKEENIE